MTFIFVLAILNVGPQFISVRFVNHSRIHSWKQPVLSKVSMYKETTGAFDEHTTERSRVRGALYCTMSPLNVNILCKMNSMVDITYIHNDLEVTDPKKVHVY